LNYVSNEIYVLCFDNCFENSNQILLKKNHIPLLIISILIYELDNEKMRDLLNTSNKELQLLEDKSGKFVCHNLKEIPVSTVSESLKLVQKGAIM
jgi:hypothetical protein